MTKLISENTLHIQNLPFYQMKHSKWEQIDWCIFFYSYITEKTSIVPCRKSKKNHPIVSHMVVEYTRNFWPREVKRYCYRNRFSGLFSMAFMWSFFGSFCVQFCFMWWNFFGKNRERDNGTVLIGKHWSFFEWAFLVLQQQPDRPSDGLTNSWRYRTATFVKIPPFSFGWFEREMSNKSWQISGILQCQHKRAKKIIKAKRAKGGHNSLQN